MWYAIVDPDTGRVLGGRGLRIGRPPEPHWVSHPRVALKLFVAEGDNERMGQLLALAKSVGGELLRIVGPPWRYDGEQLSLPMGLDDGDAPMGAREGGR